jgi:NAD-dependent DNA ligase
MGATGLFGRGIGEKKLKPLVEAYPKLMDPSIKFSKQKLVSMALQIDGFSDTSAEKFAQGFPKFKAWYKESKLKAEVKAKKPKVTGSALKGQAVLMTGFRSAELEALVIKNGGTIASSAKTATILLAKDPNGSSSKLKVARDRGIPVLTEQLFRRRYKLSI